MENAEKIVSRVDSIEALEDIRTIIPLLLSKA
jgi:hypothetical protein